MAEFEFTFDGIENYRIVIVACSIFLMWVFNLILIKICGMRQDIYTTTTIDKMDKILLNKYKHSIPLHRMMTRAIDKDGKYRRKAMTNCVIIYGTTNLIMFCILIYISLTNRAWIYNHFIKNTSLSVLYKPYQLFTCIGFSYFIFELIYNHQYDYHKWDKTTSSHHWVALFTSLFAMNGICLPFCTFYGINATIMSFPTCYFIAWTFSKYSPKYAKQTRSVSRYIYFYHLIISLFNVTGTVYICVNGIKNDTLPETYVILFLCVAVVWIYDDISTMQWLDMLSMHKYEGIQFYKKHKK